MPSPMPIQMLNRGAESCILMEVEGFAALLRHLLRQSYEGLEGYEGRVGGK